MKKLLFLTCLLAFAANCLFAANEAIKPEGDGTAESPYLLTKVENLVWMGENIAECQSSVFRLENDIDASETKTWEPEFLAIGNSGRSSDGKEHSFCGVLDGQNFSIKSLHSQRGCALFEKLSGAEIKNVFLEDISMGNDLSYYNGSTMVGGALAAYASASVITNIQVSGIIHGYSDVGGIVAEARKTKIINCSFVGIIKASHSGGGIVGLCIYDSEQNDHNYIINCKASGYIEKKLYFKNSETYIGGICGRNYGKTYIRYCHADMKVKSDGYIGGICANAIENIYKEYGQTTTNDYGIMQCYSTSSADMTLNPTVGGICALTTNTCVCFSSYYDFDLLKGTEFGTGVSSEDIKKRATFKNWDFDTVWSIQEGETTPYWKFLGENTYKVYVPACTFGEITLEPNKANYLYGENVLVKATPGEPQKTTFVSFKRDLTGTAEEVSVAVTKDLVIEGDFAKFLSEPDELDNIGFDSEYPLNGHYLQTCDFDMSETPMKNPIGFFSNRYRIDPSYLQHPFSGVYDGQNYTIKNLYLGWRSTNNYVFIHSSLFGYVDGGTICNLSLEDAEIDLKISVKLGFLSGMTCYSSIYNCHVRSDCYMSYCDHSGGLCYELINSTMDKCSFNGNIPTDLTYNYAGLVGYMDESVISESCVEMYNTSDHPELMIAGLAYYSYNSLLVNCYAKGSFRYALVANDLNDSLPVISNCYADVETETSYLGKGQYKNSYFNSNSVERVEGVTGFVSPEEMKQQETYVGWDFDEIWDIDEGVGTPYFRYALPEPVGMFALFLFALMAVRKR